MDTGGREALLYYLLNYDLSSTNLRKFPQTEALLEHKLQTMTPVEKFWHQLLVWGVLEEKAQKWVTWINRKALHDEYVKYIGHLGQSRKSSETILGMGLKKLVPSLRITTRAVNKKKVPIWELPDLATCRRAFDRTLHHQFSWDDETENPRKRKKEDEA